MSITIAPKWMIWIGHHFFHLGIILTALGLGILFFGDSEIFAMILLISGIIPLILGIIWIRNNWEKNMKDPQF